MLTIIDAIRDEVFFEHFRRLGSVFRIAPASGVPNEQPLDYEKEFRTRRIEAVDTFATIEEEQSHSRNFVSHDEARDLTWCPVVRRGSLFTTACFTITHLS